MLMVSTSMFEYFWKIIFFKIIVFFLKNSSKFADFIAKIEECLGETADSLAVHLGKNNIIIFKKFLYLFYFIDNAVTKFDETADKIGEKAVNTHETMKKAGAERCRALQQAVASLMQSEIVSRQSLADVYQALLASPAQVQALVLSLVDKAKQQQEVSCIVLMTIEWNLNMFCFLKGVVGKCSCFDCFWFAYSSRCIVWCVSTTNRRSSFQSNFFFLQNRNNNYNYSNFFFCL